jgi:hypothetical protein
MVRITTSAGLEEFWIAAVPDKTDAEQVVKTRVDATAREEAEGVAALSQNELAGQGIQAGDVKRA